MASSAALLALILSLFAAAVSCCRGQAAGAGVSNGVVAIYSLGDSITDTGNLVREAPPGVFETIKHFPYGVTFGRPTGRCSDGLLMIDFLARDLGLPFLNPYLGKNKSFEHGVNFAVAGATAMDPSDQLNSSMSMPPAFANSLKRQLRWFKDFLKSSFSTDAEIRRRLQKSLVLVGEIGGNDYNYAFFGNSSVTEVEKLIPGVVRTIIDAAKEVLNMGANRVIIPGNFPIGCVPGYLAMKAGSSDYDSMGCLREMNLFAAKHNVELQRAVTDLRSLYPNASIAYADYYNSFLELIGNATTLGFDAASTRKACCGAGGGNFNFDWTRMCGDEGTAACKEPSKYVSWDGIHMTEAAYRTMSRLIYHGKYMVPQILNFPEKNDQA